VVDVILMLQLAQTVRQYWIGQQGITYASVALDQSSQTLEQSEGCLGRNAMLP
jgi:hypothetical protein